MRVSCEQILNKRGLLEKVAFSRNQATKWPLVHPLPLYVINESWVLTQCVIAEKWIHFTNDQVTFLYRSLFYFATLYRNSPWINKTSHSFGVSILLLPMRLSRCCLAKQSSALSQDPCTVVVAPPTSNELTEYSSTYPCLEYPEITLKISWASSFQLPTHLSLHMKL